MLCKDFCIRWTRRNTQHKALDVSSYELVLSDPVFAASSEGAKVEQAGFLNYGKSSRLVLHEEKVAVPELRETIVKYVSEESRFVNIKSGLSGLSLATTK